MKKKTANMMKGLGIAMAVGSVVATAGASMNQSGMMNKRTVKKAVNKVTDFVNGVSTMIKKVPS